MKRNKRCNLKENDQVVVDVCYKYPVTKCNCWSMTHVGPLKANWCGWKGVLIGRISKDYYHVLLLTGPQARCNMTWKVRHVHPSRTLAQQWGAYGTT